MIPVTDHRKQHADNAGLFDGGAFGVGWTGLNAPESHFCRVSGHSVLWTASLKPGVGVVIAGGVSSLSNYRGPAIS